MLAMYSNPYAITAGNKPMANDLHAWVEWHWLRITDPPRERTQRFFPFSQIILCDIQLNSISHAFGDHAAFIACLIRTVINLPPEECVFIQCIWMLKNLLRLSSLFQECLLLFKCIFRSVMDGDQNAEAWDQCLIMWKFVDYLSN